MDGTKLAAPIPHAVAIVEAALILEAGAAKRFDRLIVVTCTDEQRAARFAARQKIDLEAARKEVARRMAAQLPEAEKIKAADYVIDNSGSLDRDARTRCSQVGKNCGSRAPETLRRTPAARLFRIESGPCACLQSLRACLAQCFGLEQNPARPVVSSTRVGSFASLRMTHLNQNEHNVSGFGTYETLTTSHAGAGAGRRVLLLHYLALERAPEVACILRIG